MNRYLKSYEFMKSLQQTADDIDTSASLEKVSCEIDSGISGDDGLLMFPAMDISHITVKETPYECVSLDIGGSTLKCARVSKDAYGNISLSDVKKGDIIGREKPVSEKDLFKYFSSFAELNETTKNLCVSFSHYMESLPGFDGRIVSWCKEVQVTDRSDKTIAELFREASNNPDLNVFVANDSVASMMGAVNVFDRDNAVLGIVIGTGFNICWRADSGIVYNTEAGDSHAFPNGEADMEIDVASAFPGHAMTEKKTSGLYLCPIINICIHIAADIGLLKDGKRFYDLQLREYSSISQTDDDSKFVSGIVYEVERRSAKIAAICTAAMLRKNSCLSNGAFIGTEGSVINKMPDYKEMFLEELRAALPSCGEIHLQYSDSAGLKGVSKLTSMVEMNI